jgi:hypothetical protein
MGMMQEFREFAVKGNVIDLAVGVIIGAAFGKIVDAVVSDLIMPVVGLVFGKLDFSSMYVLLGTVPPGTDMSLEALRKAGVPVAGAPCARPPAGWRHRPGRCPRCRRPCRGPGWCAPAAGPA